MEFIVKAGEYLRELESTAYWLQLLVDRHIVDEMRMAGLRKECDELAAIFTAIVKSSKK
jgi:four helix bundle protein